MNKHKKKAKAKRKAVPKTTSLMMLPAKPAIAVSSDSGAAISDAGVVPLPPKNETTQEKYASVSSASDTDRAIVFAGTIAGAALFGGAIGVYCFDQAGAFACAVIGTGIGAVAAYLNARTRTKPTGV